MKFYSTRDTKRACGCSLREAAMMGLAPDGGLFVPERIPQADMAEVERLAGESYAAMAGYLAGLFFGDDFDPQLLRRELESLYDFPVPLRAVGCGRYTLELFHGPTCAFKDFGAGFMGRSIGLLGAAGERLVILTATSGDTGSAVAHGFYGVPGVDVVVLYPEGKISRLQECQMTALGGNIHPLRVAGTFDDCQRLVKELFADAEFRKRRRVTSANSINLLRWIPQAFYYFYGYCRWRQAAGGDRPVIVVPSGNYGNLAAGMLAQRMGLPVGGFVAASNINDVVPEFLRTGVYRPRPSVFVQGLFKGAHGFFTGLFAQGFQRAVENLFSSALLAVVHETVHELGDQTAVVQRIGQHFPLRDRTFTGHDILLENLCVSASPAPQRPGAP